MGSERLDAGDRELEIAVGGQYLVIRGWSLK